MAFAALYRSYYPQLQPMIRKADVADLDANDILQSAFLKIWLHREELPGLADVRPWIFKVVYREYLIAVRKKIRYGQRLYRYAHLPVNDNRSASPLHTVNYQEIRSFVQEIVHALPEQRRRIYQLSRDEGLKVAEIAEKLSISPNTVKSTLQTVLGLLRERLKQAGYDPLVIVFFLDFFLIR